MHCQNVLSKLLSARITKVNEVFYLENSKDFVRHGNTGKNQNCHDDNENADQPDDEQDGGVRGNGPEPLEGGSAQSDGRNDCCECELCTAPNRLDAR